MNGLKILDQAEQSPVSNARPLTVSTFKGRAAVITLGCAKNHVDSEVMLGVLRQSGFEIVGEVAEADVAVVNTCGFLQSSVQESIECILDVADFKEQGRLRKLIVAGCAVERYGKDGTSMRDALPEVDHFISVDDILEVGKVAQLGIAMHGVSLSEVLDSAARPYFLYDEQMPREIATPPHTAYVKISEGCDRPCTFCIIPKIRGTYRSRALDSVVCEVEELGRRGVKEISLVAQDLTSFGVDSPEGRSLPRLLRKLDASKAVEWIRLLYAYPIGIDEELIDTVLELPRVCNYLDLPLQHSSEELLRVMKRPLGRYAPRNIIEFITTRAPQIKLRTTFIVGFPGERDEHVRDLEAFIEEGHFSSVGVFAYSREEGTPAHDLAQQIPEPEKTARRDQLMRAQQRVIASRLGGYIGQELEVLVDGAHEETELLMAGRTRFQALEVDGQVILNDIEEGVGEVPPGALVRAHVTEVAGYDLVARVVGVVS